MAESLGRQIRRLQGDLVKVRKELAGVKEHELGMVEAYQRLGKALSHLVRDDKGSWSISSSKKFNAAMDEAIGVIPGG